MSLHGDELYWCRVGGVFNFIVEESEECLLYRCLLCKVSIFVGAECVKCEI